MCDVEYDVLVCGMLHNARCGNVVWNCGEEECGICNVLKCQLWKMMQCVVMSDVVVWCKIKMWTMV